MTPCALGAVGEGLLELTYFQRFTHGQGRFFLLEAVFLFSMWELYFSNPREESRRLLVIGLGSALALGGFIAAWALHSRYFSPPAEPPPVPIVLLKKPNPAPGKPAAGAPKPSSTPRPTTPTPHKSLRVVRPNPLAPKPPLAPVPERPSAPEDEDDSDAHDTEGGSPGGGGGTGTGGGGGTGTGAGAGSTPKPKVVPAILIRKDIMYSADPHLPDVVKAQRRGQTVTGSYKICIAANGTISSVETVMSIPGADENIAQTLHTWRYKPQSIPICFVQFLEFVVQ